MTRIYTYARHEDEADLCRLEMMALFGYSQGIRSAKPVIEVNACNLSEAEGMIAPVAIDPTRSPFLKRRIDVVAEADDIAELSNRLKGYDLGGSTFKVLYTEGDVDYTYGERRELERIIGGSMNGKADMRSPMLTLGLIRWRGKWRFGPCRDNGAAWLAHSRKPQNYSTGLPARTARALVNIAVGDRITGQTLLDPCCGMGTVLIEALSMGVESFGCDLNPLAVRGARVNLKHFGYSDSIVQKGDMRALQGRFNCLILDLPYNLCSVLPTEDQLEMLKAARRLGEKAVIVTTADIRQALEISGFRIKDAAVVRKGSFIRYASVVE